jgi:hypothetical protein
MANVNGKALKSFTYKGKAYKEGDDVSIGAGHAARYEKLNYIKIPKAEEPKVQKAEEKKQK